MLRSYRHIFTVDGAWQFSLGSWLARLPGAMVALSIILMISQLTGSYALAGSVSATYVVSQAICAPILARKVDQLGQRKVMLPAGMVVASALTVLIIAVTSSWPHWTFFAFASLAGCCVGSMNALVRARWSAALSTPADLHAAYAWESTLDETCFILGPVFATLLTTTVAPWAGAVTAALLVVVGYILFLSQRASEPTPSGKAPKGRKRTSVLHSRAMIIAIAVFISIGAIFGACDVSVVAFATERGREYTAGIMLGFFSAGSAVSGLLYGARAWRSPLWVRFPVGIVALAAGSSLFLTAPSIEVMGGLMFITGFAISPTIINGNTLISQHVAPKRLTEGLAWMSTGMNIGVSLGSTLGGMAVDHAGSHGGFTTVVGAAGASVILGILSIPVLRRTPRIRPVIPPSKNAAGRKRNALGRASSRLGVPGVLNKASAKRKTKKAGTKAGKSAIASPADQSENPPTDSKE